MLFHPNYPCISGHFTVSPQRPWSWWIVTKSWDTNRCPKMWNGEEGDTNNWCLVFWRGANSANLEIKQHWTYLHAIWYVSINDVVTTWICFLFFFLVSFGTWPHWQYLSCTPPSSLTSWIVRRCIGCCEPLSCPLVFKRWNWRNDEIGAR